MNSIGEVVDGELGKLIIALHNPKVRPDASQPRLGDFITIKTTSIRIVGIVSHMAFKQREQPQPLGLTPEQLKAVMPDIEDIVYANVLKLAYVPVIGYLEDNKAHQITPPLLPDIHDEAFIADDELVKTFHTQQATMITDYLPRLLKEDVENQTEVLAAVYKRLNRVLRLDDSDFLKKVNTAFEEARREQIPASFASTLSRLIR
ncbi:MAG: hypothetical protein ACQXXG_08935 [Candidatus Bathyarchaeia archaeon]|jgi:glutathionyl-hydroquinone reductase